MKGKIYATGKTGTIGKYFGKDIFDLKFDLSAQATELNLNFLSTGDILIHAGGLVGNTLVDSDPIRAYNINVVSTKNLALQALKANLSKFVFLSSSHIYAPSDSKLKESDLVQPTSEYAKQKIEAENILLELFQKKLNKLCILRIFSVLDWDVKEFTLGGGIKKLAIPNSNYKLNYALDVRDFLTPKQISDVIVQISTTDEISGILNLCSGMGISIENAAKIMLTDIGIALPEDRVIRVNSTNPKIIGDNSKLISLLPKLNLIWKPSPKSIS
jgi:UDP-glucose 4-epimerase/GDP-4-dehydro-6-deoxy-D-mannose reductase